jgi:hypothetical protein
MPHKLIDYSKTIIYKIVCKDLEVTEVYVGHTTNFKTRKSTHKCHCNNENDKCYNIKVYKYIRDNGGWNNFNMIEIEKYIDCKDSNEALARERYWYEQLNAKLNSQYPKRTQYEYYEENKEEIKEQHKIYTKENKDEIKLKRKIYYEDNKDKILEQKKQYIKNNKKQIKKYREEHKEERKKYNEDNKDIIKEQQKQRHINKINIPYTCSCNWIGNEISKYWHFKNSVQHKEYLESLV